MCCEWGGVGVCIEEGSGGGVVKNAMPWGGTLWGCVMRARATVVGEGSACVIGVVA